MTDLAVFADGPLKGTTQAVRPFDRMCGLSWRWQPSRPSVMALVTGLAPLLPDFETVTYRFSDFAMFTRTVLVGSVAQPPDAEACFEVLLSDAAKKSALFRQA